MSYRKKRNKIIFWALLIIYTLAIAAAVVFALRTLWDFADLYEKSMPDDVIDSYVSQLSTDLWEEGLADTMSLMEHPFQSNEECKAVVMELLSGEINHVRSVSADPNLNAYSLRVGKSSFGKVYLVKDETKNAKFEIELLDKEIELPWDLRPWLVHSQEFDLSGLYTSVEVTVPATYSVQLNGITLGPEYIVEQGIQYDSLRDFYDVNPNLPTKTTYRADKIIGYITPVILDENGNAYEIDSSRDDSQFIKPCDPEKFARLDGFCSKFTEKYLRYTSGIMGKYSSGGYSELTGYVMPGGDLDKRLYEALDGLGWAHTHAFRLDSYQLVNAIDLGEGYYVCDVVAQTTSVTQGSGENVDINELKIIVFDNYGDIRALSLA